jgi:hypothetical protein
VSVGHEQAVAQRALSILVADDNRAGTPLVDSIARDRKDDTDDTNRVTDAGSD